MYCNNLQFNPESHLLAIEIAESFFINFNNSSNFSSDKSSQNAQKLKKKLHSNLPFFPAFSFCSLKI